MYAPLALLVVSLVLCAGVQAQIQNGTVNATYDDTDHRISWLPSVCNATIKSNTTVGLCDGTWYAFMGSLTASVNSITNCYQFFFFSYRTISDSKGMPDYASYFNDTAHITNTTGASCTVHFRGVYNGVYHPTDYHILLTSPFSILSLYQGHQYTGSQRFHLTEAS
jgi:hypothetical protein